MTRCCPELKRRRGGGRERSFEFPIGPKPIATSTDLANEQTAYLEDHLGSSRARCRPRGRVLSPLPGNAEPRPDGLPESANPQDEAT